MKTGLFNVDSVDMNPYYTLATWVTLTFLTSISLSENIEITKRSQLERQPLKSLEHSKSLSISYHNFHNWGMHNRPRKYKGRSWVTSKNIIGC